MMTFQLHPRLAADCHLIGHFELCQLLLMNDCHYPWFILVPQRADKQEIYQLTHTEQVVLMEESSYVAENLADLFQADKMNIATIGNLVPQLHIHHIVRYQHDKSWPAPVWGKFAAEPYEEKQLADCLSRVRSRLTRLS